MGCGKRPSFGVAGIKPVKYCQQHALDGMFNGNCRRCIFEGCSKMPSFGVVGSKTVEYCAQHALEGMVDVKNTKCRTEGCV